MKIKKQRKKKLFVTNKKSKSHGLLTIAKQIDFKSMFYGPHMSVTPALDIVKYLSYNIVQPSGK